MLELLKPLEQEIPMSAKLPKIQYNFAPSGTLNSPLSDFMSTKRTEALHY